MGKIHHAIHGKTHYFDWAIFNRYVTNYQRVYRFFLIRHWILDGQWGSNIFQWDFIFLNGYYGIYIQYIVPIGYYISFPRYYGIYIYTPIYSNGYSYKKIFRGISWRYGLRSHDLSAGPLDLSRGRSEGLQDDHEFFTTNFSGMNLAKLH